MKDTAGGFRLARWVAACLAQNGVAMLSIATGRALRCMVMLGVG